MTKKKEAAPTPASVSGTAPNNESISDITTTNDSREVIIETNTDEHAAHTSVAAEESGLTPEQRLACLTDEDGVVDIKPFVRFKSSFADLEANEQAMFALLGEADKARVRRVWANHAHVNRIEKLHHDGVPLIDVNRECARFAWKRVGLDPDEFDAAWKREVELQSGALSVYSDTAFPWTVTLMVFPFMPKVNPAPDGFDEIISDAYFWLFGTFGG